MNVRGRGWRRQGSKRAHRRRRAVAQERAISQWLPPGIEFSYDRPLLKEAFTALLVDMREDAFWRSAPLSIPSLSLAKE